MSQPSFTLVQLRYFAAAAELGSMTAASRDLLVSQSAISTAIAQLENEVGVQLLLRHHARGLTLTAAGRDFFRELRGFLVHAEELAESARSAGGAMVGELSVGCFATLAPFHLPRLLAAYEEQYSRVHVTALEAEHGQLKRSLRAGECELALMYGYDLNEDIEHVLVDSAPPYALVAAGHRLARRKRVWLAELADEPMVLLDLPHTRTYFESLLAAAGVEARVRHRSPGYETVRTLVAHGHGFALLNQRPVRDDTYDGERVVPLALRDDLEPLEVVVAWMRGVRLTRRAQSFIALARTLYTGE